MRITTQLALFFIAFNAFAAMMIGFGVTDDLGINLETGEQEQLEEATSQESVDLGNGVGGTLFGMYNVLTNQVGTIVDTVTPGFAMMKLFLPAKVVEPFAACAGLFTLADLLSYARGVDV